MLLKKFLPLLLLTSTLHATTIRNLTIYIAGDKTNGDKIMSELIASTTTHFYSRLIADNNVTSFSISISSKIPEEAPLPEIAIPIGDSSITYEVPKDTETDPCCDVQIKRRYIPLCPALENGSMGWSERACPAERKVIYEDIYRVFSSTMPD